MAAKSKHSEPRRLRTAAACLVLFVIACLPRGLPAAAPATPDAVKAAFLFRFGEYAEWPEPSDPGPAVIAVLGEPAVARELRRLAPGRSLHGRDVLVREPAKPRDLIGADILYVGSGTAIPLRRVIELVHRSGKPVLVVTDSPRGLEAGAAIKFVTSNQRIRFEVAPAAAEAHGVKLSSRLLAVAARVVEPGSLSASRP